MCILFLLNCPMSLLVLLMSTLHPLVKQLGHIERKLKTLVPHLSSMWHFVQIRVPTNFYKLLIFLYILDVFKEKFCICETKKRQNY